MELGPIYVNGIPIFYKLFLNFRTVQQLLGYLERL